MVVLGLAVVTVVVGVAYIEHWFFKVIRVSRGEVIPRSRFAVVREPSAHPRAGCGHHPDLFSLEHVEVVLGNVFYVFRRSNMVRRPGSHEEDGGVDQG